MKATRMKRYNDTAFDFIISKLGKFYEKFKSMFGQLPTGRKVLLLIGKAIKLFGIANGATDIVVLMSVQKKVQAIRALLNGAAFTIPVPGVNKVLGWSMNYLGNRFEKSMTAPLLKGIIINMLTVGLGVITEKIAQYGKESKTKAKEFIKSLRGKKDSAISYRDAVIAEMRLKQYIDSRIRCVLRKIKRSRF